MLRRRPFGDSEEVRRTMPELAAVPREAGFREELVRQFRVSADRPLAIRTVILTKPFAGSLSAMR